jgi:RHS repeat-associated protein
MPSCIVYDEGRVVYANNSRTYFGEVYLKDHLGNVRVACRRENGVLKTRQVDSYYPFGMNIKGLTLNSTDVNRPNKYLYNGKQMQDEMGLVWLDYGARFYDAVLGRWHSPDPSAEERFSFSPYNFCSNNPITRIDSDGALDDIVITGENNSSVTLKTGLIDVEVDASSLGVDFGGSYSLQGEDVVSAGLDIVGILDPTGVADGLNAGLQAKNGNWLGAGISVLGIVPYVGDLAKVGKVGKDVKIINEAIDAVKVVNGNSKASTKAQHVYEIVNITTSKVEKVGISGGKVSKAGDSYRATSQVNKLNKAGGNYTSRVVEKIPAGKGARQKALDAEKRVTNANKGSINKDLHKRPKPQ